MNDPGLDAPIEDNAKAIERRENEPEALKEEEAEEQAEDDFMQPSRWWFASTAAPLIAGTFGPMSSAFNLCALIEPWRIHIPPGLAGPQSTTIADPKWLLAVNGISFATAIIANIALLLNMARRLPFPIAQPITIIGWYISSFLLMGLVIAAPHYLHSDDANHIFSQAFYYAMISSVLYFVISTLMVLTVYGAFRGRYSREFKLTMSQRTLMLQTISFMIYLLAGAAVYAKIEGWKFLDAVYWADVTLLTVGLGDFSPTSALGQGLLFPYAIGGILMLGLVIGSIRSLVLERGKKKMGARMVEKTRQKAIRRMDLQQGTVKLTRFKSRDIVAKGSSERDRREQEFRVMREIQAQAAQTRRWMSLGTSALVWFGLWLIGALVFWKSEHNQGWTYYEAVYFSYTSLLTIGYGVPHPENEASKPFFVVWSLMAVPAMTVLISNMGDTIVKGIRDLALWVGEWTVLPGEHGPKETLRRTASHITQGRWGNTEFSESEPVAAASEAEQGHSHHRKTHADAVNRVAGEFEENEKEASQDAAMKGDWFAENKHHYHYLLMKEIKRVMPHLNDTPPRKYSYKEWEWFLKLVGQDESSPKHHHVVQPGRSKERGTKGSKQDPGMQQIGADDVDNRDGHGHVKQWSWIGKNSPLMGNKDEAEWVLERLAAALERELEEQRGTRQSEKQKREASAGGNSED